MGVALMTIRGLLCPSKGDAPPIASPTPTLLAPDIVVYPAYGLS